MTREEFLKFHEKCCEKMRDISARKGNDYSREGQFDNLMAAEAMGVASAEQAFLVRMLDKMCRVSNLVGGTKQRVLDESVEDTLLDLANYSILMAAFLRHRAEGKEGSNAPPLQLAG